MTDQNRSTLRITHCDHPECGVDIVWLPFRTAALSVDAGTVDPSDKKFDPLKHTPHLTTCPGAKEFQAAAGLR